MSIEEVGFITGIFRLHTVDQYVTPTYYLKDKNHIHFPKEVIDNVQFKDLFMEPWRHWQVYIRPTVTGMLIVRLKRYYTKQTPILTIASDVVRLQTAFDLRSARGRLCELEQIEANGPEEKSSLETKKRSIRELIEWLGGHPTSDMHPEFVPVQWKLLIEVCRQLVKDVDFTIPLENNPIHLQDPEHTMSTPVHDSFVVYHIDEMNAVANMIKKTDGKEDQLVKDKMKMVGQSGEKSLQSRGRPKIPVDPEDISNSEEIQQNLIGLIEGSILKTTSKNLQPGEGATDRLRGTKQMKETRRTFPHHSSKYMHEIFEQNQATWKDEICLLTSRAAIIIPSRWSSSNELFISNFSATTAKVMYIWYWEALERMLEFVAEVRALAQIMERLSSDLLNEFEQEIWQIRSGMSQRDIQINYQTLSQKIDRVANLSRMLSVGQSLSTPSVWSRAEFAIEKARLLFDRQEVPLLIAHTERNVNNLANLLNHVDELYLADLTERSNQIQFRLSFLVAGLSLGAAVFAIPSFLSSIQRSMSDIINLSTFQQLLQSNTDRFENTSVPFFVIASIGMIILFIMLIYMRLARRDKLLAHKSKIRTGNINDRPR